MGQTKQLLPLAEKPVIRHCIDALQAARIAEIVVVVNEESNDIADALRGLPLIIAVNKVRGSDMAESVKAGLTTLSHSASGVLICLSDHPLVRPETIEALIKEHMNLPDKIIIPCYNGRRGHPSLFPKSVLQGEHSGATLRDIIRKESHRVVLIDTGDEGVVLDMDTPEEFHHIIDKMRKKHT